MVNGQLHLLIKGIKQENNHNNNNNKKNYFSFGSFEFSNCTNPVVEESINQANEEIAKGGNPSESLDGLSIVLKENEIASGNIVQLDKTVRLAIEKQAELLSGNLDPNSKDASSKNFTNSIVNVNNVLLTNEVAFWGLEPIARSEAIGQVQKNVDDTLFLLAENLIDQVYKNMYPNIGNFEEFYNFYFNIIANLF